MTKMPFMTKNYTEMTRRYFPFGEKKILRNKK